MSATFLFGKSLLYLPFCYLKHVKMKNYKTAVLNVCFFFIVRQNELHCKVKTQIKICGFCVTSLKILLVIELIWGKI